MRRAAGEIAATVATGGLYLFFENVVGLKLPFLALCALCWTGYLLRRFAREPGILAAWGIRRDNLARAALLCLPFFALLALLLTGYRLALGWRTPPATSLWIFGLYPLWAFLQQFALQALVASNLDRLGLKRWGTAAVTAVLFGLAHAPDWPLAALCAGAGFLWACLFLRERNILPLALSHAWLGTLTYYWVLERDPWREFFQGSGLSP